MRHSRFPQKHSILPKCSALLAIEDLLIREENLDDEDLTDINAVFVKHRIKSKQLKSLTRETLQQYGLPDGLVFAILNVLDKV